MGRLGLVCALLAGALTGCASEDSDAIAVALAQENARALAGVEKISRSLDPLDLASRGFGEGVHEVERASRALGALETDERASRTQSLLAVLIEARVWDDTVRAIEEVDLSTYEPKQQELLRNLLREKAFPARVAASNAYQRALRLACRSGMDEHLPEILDGVARYDGEARPLESACRE